MINLLNLTDFLSYSGIDIADINETFVQSWIDILNETIEEELGSVFELHPNFVQKYYSHNSNFMMFIDNWQPAGVVDSITVTDGGSGYSDTPTISIDGNATAKAVVVGGVITEIKIVYQGLNYTTAPIITITDSTGVNATATATISNLKVEVGSDYNATLSEIIEGQGYIIIPFKPNTPTKTYPIRTLKVGCVAGNQFLKITGTYGYAPSIPASEGLQGQLYSLLATLTYKNDSENSSGGRGETKKSKIGKVDKEYFSDSDSSKKNAYNSMSLPVKIQSEALGLIAGIKDSYTTNTSDYFSLI